MLLMWAVCAPLWGEEAVLTLKIQDTAITLYKMEGVWVSKECLTENCLALQPPAQKEMPASNSYWGHPAAAFCALNGGDNVIATHPSGDEDGLCWFKDNSMIIDWDYYYRHERKK